MTFRFATRHAPPASQMRRHPLRGLGHRPSGEVQEAGGGLLPQAPKQFRANGGTGCIAPESLWRGEHEARTMRALRERPCQRQRQAHMPRGKPPPASAPRGMRHQRSGSDGILLSVERGSGERRAESAESRAGKRGSALPREGEGAHDARPTGKKPVPAATSGAHASGKPTPASAPRGMRHQRCTYDGIHLWGLGRSPSGGVQRAGGRPLPRGTGARSYLSSVKDLCNLSSWVILSLCQVQNTTGALAPPSMPTIAAAPTFLLPAMPKSNADLTSLSNPPSSPSSTSTAGSVSATVFSPFP